jgi:alpha-1,2-mannosyltransferase
VYVSHFASRCYKQQQQQQQLIAPLQHAAMVQVRFPQAAVVTFAASVCVVFVVLSGSRIYGTVHNYGAPMQVYSHLHETLSQQKHAHVDSTKHVRVCVGKEWYRFASSFFLPSSHFELSFVSSGFKGLLPKQYERINSTWTIPTEMNDENREEPSRYVCRSLLAIGRLVGEQHSLILSTQPKPTNAQVDASQCHYMIDLDLPHQSEEHYIDDTDTWETLFEQQFLDAHNSHKALYRALWVPSLSAQHNSFAPYVLLRNKRLHV